MQAGVALDHSIDVGDARVHYVEAGPQDAAPLLLLHGLGQSSTAWERVMPALARERHVVALDFPGFGHSAAAGNAP
ncbi:MAG TPA: alpha/beta fold hydrolase, partial [Candidatus Eremiobacteraceae bacterium]|nr:alpha/beta fold hydrolase [Candidatus Eremiobacteraceae bacterium]